MHEGLAPDILHLKDQNLYEYRKLQYNDPEGEFKLQDDIYLNGFKRAPRPIAFGKIGDKQILAMEEFPGYTLEEIQAVGATIEDPSWEELERLIFNLNINAGVVHRDLGNQNIFLKTDQPLEKGAKLSGEINVIDFGLSKKISGDRPDDDDYRLTIGSNMIRYPSDRSKVEALRPIPGRDNLFAH